MSPEMVSAEGDGRLQIEVTEGDPPTVALRGEVDPYTAPRLLEALDRLVDGGATGVRIECRDLQFIDSSGLRVLVATYRRLGGRPTALVMAGASATLRRLLEVTGLDAHLTVETAPA